MLGVALGDIVGAPYEHRPHKSVTFELFSPWSRFTDDTVLSVAIADALVRGHEYGTALRSWGRCYPDAGYGGTFIRWLIDDAMEAYGSWGNGAAMRAPAIGWAFDDLERVLIEAARSAAPTHGHAEGIKGAQAVAMAVFLARTGTPKDAMRHALATRFDYDLWKSVDELRPFHRFDVSCQGSVPEALIAFLDAQGVEEAVRLAVSLGGDADTQAAIAGAVAEAYYGGLPSALEAEVRSRLDGALNAAIDSFYARYVTPRRRASSRAEG